MGLRHTVPLKFSPTTCSDALDSSDLPPGAMSQLRNLIPDPTTKNLWQCRPAGTLLFTFTTSSLFNPWSSGWSSGFGGALSSGDGFISVLRVFGSRAYGLISKSAFGTDIPFCLDLLTNSLVSISGVTSANTPTSLATSGAWTPPTCDVVGTLVIFTHPGFPGTPGKFFGWIDISNPSALSWNEGNTTTNLLPAVPVAVKNFNGRAYYLVNPSTGQPAAYFSDVLVPTTITNANQILTFDDNVPLTAIGALPLNNQLGGIIQALMVFKGVSNIYQVTGDPSTNNLSKNSLNIATGTLAPNSIVPTPKGLAFMSPEGIRLIDFNAHVTDPLGDGGTGIAIPFIYSQQPSRVVAAFGSDTLRVTTQNTAAIGAPQQEWWYDFTRSSWSGPHDFAASMIQPYRQTFIVAPVGVQSKLFQSDVTPNNNSTYIENGTQLTYTWQTSMLPNTDQMAQNAMCETTIHMAIAPGVPPIQVSAVDQNGNVFDNVQIPAVTGTTLWGQFNWGQAVWLGGASALSPRPISWHYPIVFQRMALIVTGTSAQAAKIGRMYLRYEQLGYMLQSA